ncbi:MAG: chromate resistance protein ChrB domain-containing protein [Nitrospiria bacterium]
MVSLLKHPGWLLFVNTLPGQNPTLRMRIWRALKGLGAAVLRDGVYLLPDRVELNEALEEQRKEIIQSGGSAYLFFISPDVKDGEEDFLTLFDRSKNYGAILSAVADLKKKLKRLAEPEIHRTFRQLKRNYEEILAVDYFPGPAKEQVEAALMELEVDLNRIFSPGEPLPAATVIQKLSRTEYLGRKWATREHLWVDRLASAWLIRRFIDSKARFVWLKHPSDCPKGTLGFDFDGAPFTHIGARVTFEVLLASFDLEKDLALKRLGSMVHYLDAGGIKVPEAAGFEAMVAGARQSCPNDDLLLEAVSKMFDYLYSTYTVESNQEKSPGS